ncbi:MAG TPA: hypothetical protein PK854_06060 [Oscillospiraceae bacterium]|nr:hypothetical protein [Oscillospiraceae bacterium]HPS34810.1 hypothetical protein [Oscillospiraceae bacterium]
MKKLITLVMVAMLAVCCFTINTFARTAEGYVDLTVSIGGGYSSGSTMVGVYPDEDPLTFSPIWAYAETCFGPYIEGQDYASSDGSYAVWATSFGGTHYDYEYQAINAGNSGYGQA